MKMSFKVVCFLTVCASLSSVMGNPDDLRNYNAPVRLVNSDHSCSGRVEIFLRGHWGTVCDDSWDLNDANVVCRQVGCGRARSAPELSAFGQGSGPIWLDDVTCSGDELSITDCRHSGFGVHNCGHNEDASAVCEDNAPVRLVNSDHSCSGRVEIFLRGQWGTVCDDSWDLNDANVVCRQVGCGRARFAPQLSAFGQGSGPIWLDDVRCSGNESSITDCRHSGFGVHNCGHKEDASAVCEADSGIDSRVRLADGGNSSCSGRVEIFHRGQWGTVCDDSWDLLDAQVVCKQLGCGKVLSASLSATSGPGRGPIWLDDVMCTGSESQLSECHHQGFESHNCGNNEDAGVVCEATAPVRLVNSDHRCSGRVEIFLRGQWGTVCDDSWDLNDANVVCRQMGCGRARSVPQLSAFGQGSGPIWLDDVRCSGNESSITDCRHSGFGVHNCGHNEDASAVCEGCKQVVQTVCKDLEQEGTNIRYFCENEKSFNFTNSESSNEECHLEKCEPSALMKTDRVVTVTISKMTGGFWSFIRKSGQLCFDEIKLRNPKLNETETKKISRFASQTAEIKCEYPPNHKESQKFLCKGDTPLDCEELILITPKDSNATDGRFHSRDDKVTNSFYVYIYDLMEEDSGTYWCIPGGPKYTRIQLSVGMIPGVIAAIVVGLVLLVVVLLVIILLYRRKLLKRGEPSEQRKNSLNNTEDNNADNLYEEIQIQYNKGNTVPSVCATVNLPAEEMLYVNVYFHREGNTVR